MTAAEWRFALASSIGTAHLALGTPCQDAARCQVMATLDGTPSLVAAVADGAGSASRAEVGARLACSFFTDRVSDFYSQNPSVEGLARRVVEDWLAEFGAAVQRLAEAESLAPRDYACTVLVAVVEPDRAAFFQIGDGAIVVAASDDPDEYLWVFWPQRGEYANWTHFATEDNAAESLEFDVVPGRLDEVALFSDGLQPLALHYQTRTAYLPFFRPLFAPVRLEPPGLSDRLSSALSQFLDSPRVNARTDDDKTLILATRRELTPTETGNPPGEPPDGARR